MIPKATAPEFDTRFDTCCVIGYYVKSQVSEKTILKVVR